MSTQVSPLEIPTMSDADALRLSNAYGDSDATMAARVAVVRRISAAGITVRAMSEEMAARKASDPSINAYSQATYGYALAASAAIDASGVAFNDTTTAQRAVIHRAAKHVGVKSLRDTVRNVLAPLEDTVLAPERLALVVSAAEVALTTTRGDRVKSSTREGRPNSGVVVDTEDDATASQPVGSILPRVNVDALDGIRAAVKFLQNGGELSRDMESAIAELTSAASAARKRNRATVTA
ncbi:hypothetical protein SEA_PHINKY_107 [Microbacterium phage Phinky]|nr:hypothetical protein SEA_PHINKY_107 [Microbacterium phage Phinky]